MIVWKQPEGGWFDLYEIIPGFALSVLAIILVSRYGPRADAALAHEFNQIRARF